MSRITSTPVAGRDHLDQLLARITSPAATRYQLVKEGEHIHVFVYCALDTIEYALVAGGTFHVIGDSPAGPAVRFVLTPDGPDPDGGWISTVMPAQIAHLPPVASMPSRCCPYIHFFASREAYAEWHNALPEKIRAYIECITLSEAWRRAQSELAACQTKFSCV